MEQHVSYIFFNYRGHLLKGAAIFDATGTNVQQKKLLFYWKKFIINTAKGIKQ